jgi:hypothetical protein
LSVLLISVALVAASQSTLASVDLDSEAHLKLTQGLRLRVAGDVNDDGQQDVVVADCGFNEGAGRVFVIEVIRV